MAKRSSDELIEILAQQRAALAASCQNYDNGSQWEAARLATTVFNLVHDGGKKNTSLLTQLGVRGSLRFVSSYRLELPPGFKPVMATPFLVGFRGGSDGGAMVPLFQLPSGGPHQPRMVQFDKWWAKEDIYFGGEETHLCRRRLIFALRHQDGGGHIGELTDPAYVRLKAGPGIQVKRPDGSIGPFGDAARPSMRQVAWELTETLKQLDSPR